MALEDFTSYPVVYDPVMENGVVITPGLIHTKSWWENQLFAWILRLTQHSDYPSITPADLIKLYKDAELSQQNTDKQDGYVYTASEMIEGSTDTTTVYIQKISYPLSINNSLYFWDTQFLNLSGITFQNTGYYKKILIGLYVNNSTLQVTYVESSEYVSYIDAQNCTVTGSCIELATLIVHHNASTGIDAIHSSHITNYGYIPLRYHTSYQSLSVLAQKALSLYNESTGSQVAAAEMINHLQNTGIHGDAATTQSHINNTEIHPSSTTLTTHINDTGIHMERSTIETHIADTSRHGGGTASIDDSSYGSTITWSADKISTELTQIGSDVNIITADGSVYVSQLTDIICGEGIVLEDVGNKTVKLFVEHSLTWEATELYANTQIGLRKIFGRGGKLIKIVSYVECQDVANTISIDILKNDTSILGGTPLELTSSQSQLSLDVSLLADDVIAVQCISPGVGDSNIFLQLVMV